MAKLKEAFAAWARGNPVALSTFVTALSAAVGFPLAEDKVAAAITAVVYVVTQVVTYKKVTPAQNPAIPQPKVEDPDGNPVVVRANDFTPLQLPPVRSFLGQPRT
jgi:hypothetical protein